MIEYTVRVYDNGTKEWLFNGKRHREDGPAIEWADGEKYWYLNGMFHRVDGPALEYASGHREWFLNGKLHREGGPAVEYPHGYRSWWLNGIEYTEEEFNAKMNQVKELTLEEISNLLGFEVKIVQG